VGGLVAIYFAGLAVNERIFDTVMSVIEGIAVAVFIVQLPISLAIMRLDYELRWYILSDRALRIREGIITVKEQTMTFANVQQVGVKQGPLQRLLGIADVHVTSAGGAAKSADPYGASSHGAHDCYFRGVDNAGEIRDAIRARVRLHRDAGLGDPDDAHEAGDAVDAARELLHQVRALRASVAG
jgi:hypothetical protein